MKSLFYSFVLLQTISVFGQKSIEVIDTINYAKYSVYIVDESEELIFHSDTSLVLSEIGLETFGRNIYYSDRVELTIEQAEIVEKVLSKEYSKGCLNFHIEAHKELLNYPEIYDTSLLISQFNDEIIKVKKSIVKKEKKFLSKNDRYFYGFHNPSGEILVYIHFSPNYKLKYKKNKLACAPSPTNSIQPIVYNIDRNIIGVRPKYW